MATLSIKLNVKQAGVGNIDKVKEAVKQLGDTIRETAFSTLVADMQRAERLSAALAKNFIDLDKAMQSLSISAEKLFDNLQEKAKALEGIKLKNIFPKSLTKDVLRQLDKLLTKFSKRLTKLDFSKALGKAAFIEGSEARALQNASIGVETLTARVGALTLGILSFSKSRVILGRFFSSLGSQAANSVTNLSNLTNSLLKIGQASKKFNAGLFSAALPLLGGGVGGLTLGIGRAVALLVTGKTILGEISILGKRLIGQGSSALSPLQRAGRLASTLDQGLNRSFLSFGKFVALGASAVGTFFNPLLGAIPLINQTANILNIRAAKTRSIFGRFLGSSRDAFILIFQDLRKLLTNVLPKIIKFATTVANFLDKLRKKEIVGILERMTGIEKKSTTLFARVKQFSSSTLRATISGTKKLFGLTSGLIKNSVKLLALPVTAPLKAIRAARAGVQGIRQGFKNFQSNRFTSFTAQAQGPKLQNIPEAAKFATVERLLVNIDKIIKRIDRKVSKLYKMLKSNDGIKKLEESIGRLEKKLVKITNILQKLSQTPVKAAKIKNTAQSIDTMSKVSKKAADSLQKLKTNSNIGNLGTLRNPVMKVTENVMALGNTMVMVQKQTKALKIGDNISKDIAKTIKAVEVSKLKAVDAVNVLRSKIGKGLALPSPFLKIRQSTGDLNITNQFERNKDQRKRLAETNNALRSLFSSIKRGEISETTARDVDKLANALDNLFKRVTAGRGVREINKVVQAVRQLKVGDKAFDSSNAKKSIQSLFDLTSKATGVDVKTPQKLGTNFIKAINAGLKKGTLEGKREAEAIMFRFLDGIAEFFPRSLPKKGPLRKAVQKIGTLPMMLGKGLAVNAKKAGQGARKVAQTIADYFPMSPPRRGPLLGIPLSGGKIVQFINDGLTGGIDKLGGTSFQLGQAITSELERATDQLNFANRIGDSVENISVLRGVIRDTGADTSDLDFVLSNFFNRKLDPEQIKSLEVFGINLDKIKNSAAPSIELFRGLAEGVKRFGTGTDITNKALEAAGIIQTSQLIPALNTLGDDIDGLIDRQVELGLVTSTTFAKSAKDLNVTLKQFSRLKQALKESFFEGFVDDLDAALKRTLDFIQKNKEAIDTVIKFIGKVTGALFTLVTKLTGFAINKPKEAFRALVTTMKAVSSLVLTTISNIIKILGVDIKQFLKTTGTFILSTVSVLGSRAVKIAIDSAKGAAKAVTDTAGDFVGDTLVALGLLDAEAVKAGRQVEKNIKKVTKSSTSSIVADILKDVDKIAKENAPKLNKASKDLADRLFGDEFLNAQNAALSKFTDNIGDALRDPELKGIIDDFKSNLTVDAFKDTQRQVKERNEALKAATKSGINNIGAGALFPGLDGIPGLEKAIEARKRIAEVIQGVSARLRGTGSLKAQFEQELRDLENKQKKELDIIRAFGASKAQERVLLEKQGIEKTALLRKQAIEMERQEIENGASRIRRVQAEISARVLGDKKSRDELELLQLDEKHARELLQIREFMKNREEIEVQAAITRAEAVQQQERANVVNRQTGGGDFLSEIGNKIEMNPTIPMTDGMKNLIGLGEKTKETFGALGQVFGDMFEQSGKKLKAFMILQKGLSISQAIINVAVGVTKALTLPPPLSFLQAAAVAAAGGIQIAKITSQGFFKGGLVNAGTRARDSVNAMLRKDEFVLRPEAVDKLGVGFLNTVNQGKKPKTLPPVLSSAAQLPRVSLPAPNTTARFRDGGPVKPATPQAKQAVNDAAANMPAPVINQTLVTVEDKAGLKKFLASSEATNVIINDMSKNPGKYKRALRN